MNAIREVSYYSRRASTHPGSALGLADSLRRAALPGAGIGRHEVARQRVGHAILVAIYRMIKRRTPYADLDAEHLDRINPERVTRYYLKKLEGFGVKVTVRSWSTDRHNDPTRIFGSCNTWVPMARRQSRNISMFASEETS
jgi:hypothetical protein